MIDPVRAIEWAAALRELYVAAERQVLVSVARRLGRGVDRPGWAEAKLAELGALRRELEVAIARLDTDGPARLAEIVERAHLAGKAAAAEVLELPVLAGTHRFGVAALLDATSGALRGTHLAILRTATDVYRSTIAEAAALSVTGATTRREAAWVAMRRFADRGVSGFVDERGRRWDLASYTEMATRSAVGQAFVEGHLDQVVGRGHDLVRISNSPDECPRCRPWEGRVLSVGGLDPRHPALSEARAAGLFHPGCTHGLAPYIAGLSRPFGPTADRIGFEERARQRGIERHIRHWRRREAVAEAMGDARGQGQAATRVATWQAEQRRFIADTGRRRDYRREQLAGAR